MEMGETLFLVDCSSSWRTCRLVALRFNWKKCVEC